MRVSPSPLLCLRCLARSDTTLATDEPEVFELTEGVCSVCGRFGPAAGQLELPRTVRGQRSLLA